MNSLNVAMSEGVLISLLVIFGLIIVGSLAILGLTIHEYVKKEQDVTKLFKGKHRLIAISIAVATIGTFMATLPVALNATGVAPLMIMSGSLLFALSLLTFVTSFVLHYYKFNLLKVWAKESKIIAIISGVVSLVTLFILLDGLTLADAIKFPLVKGIPFDEPVVAFYALFILGGALLVLFLSDHEFFKKYGRHGILENVFYVAFPAGIVGARLWYVIGEWENGGYARDPMQIFAIRDGGLAIMGGALLGIIVGVWFFVKKRKEYDIFFAADVIIPTILIAQAIGRWGNFFNQEVYGGVIENMNNWWFVPRFVMENMFIKDATHLAGAYRQPFFLVESIFNITGYFVIRYAIGEGLKKYRKPLDLSFMYLVWYGMVRFIMEPLRDPLFNMGSGGNWSVYNALIFFVVGVLLIVLNHIFDFKKLLTKKKDVAIKESDTKHE